MYANTSEVESKASRLDNEIKQEIDIELAFTLAINTQNQQFSGQ